MRILPALSTLRHKLPAAFLCLYTLFDLGLVGAAHLPVDSLSKTVRSDGSPLCVYISSYHRGYSWSDGVERGLRSTLAGHCAIEQFDMDTKRHKSIAEIQASAAKAFALIEHLEADIVITSDGDRRFILPNH